MKVIFYFIETYAPVVNIVTIRTLLTVENQKNIFVVQMYVKTAFLYGILVVVVFME